MTKTRQNSDCLESLPEFKRVIQFDETPAKLLGGFNTLLLGKHDRVYLANIHREILVLDKGEMPLAKANTRVFKAITPKAAAKWLEHAWIAAQDRMESADITALDIFARIVADAL